MTTRIGYGRLAETSKQPKKTGTRNPRLRNQLDMNFKSYVRDKQDQCFKAVVTENSFTWVEIDVAEYQAARNRRY